MTYIAPTAAPPAVPSEHATEVAVLIGNRQNRRPHYPKSFSCADTVLGLERIFDDSVSVCIWRRAPDPAIARYLSDLAITEPIEIAARLDTDAPELDRVLRHFRHTVEREQWATDILAMIDLFATLAGVQRVGLRLTVAQAAVCPRFHVDRVALRLLSTWQGPGTEWLEHDGVQRLLLGTRSDDLADETCGLLLPGAQIHQMQPFDVALLKGELYPGNLGRGAVHRSPRTAHGAWRVMLSLDALD